MQQPLLELDRHFMAPLHRVWQAFTTIAGLAAWMGPAGTQVECRHLSLAPGGYLHYALVTEEAEPFYGRWDFVAVMPFQLLDYYLAFSDAEGNCVHHPLAPDWPLKTRVQVVFQADGDDTRLLINACPAIESSDEEIACFTASIDHLQANWQEAFSALDEYFAQERARTGRG